MKLGTLTTGSGVVTVITLNYLPAYLYYITTTQLEGIKVNVAGDGVILDLDANGLNAVSGIRRYGAVANSYLIPLADGFVPNKVVEITIINGEAATQDIFGFSLQRASTYIVSLRQTVLAASGSIFVDFAHLGILSMAATDQLTIGYVDDLVQDFTDVELLGMYTLYSNEVDSHCIDNVEGMIDYVKLIPAANRVVVVTKYVPIGELV